VRGRVDVREAQRELELNVDFALRSQGDIEVMQVCLPPLAATAFADIRWN